MTVLQVMQVKAMGPPRLPDLVALVTKAPALKESLCCFLPKCSTNLICLA